MCRSWYKNVGIEVYTDFTVDKLDTVSVKNIDVKVDTDPGTIDIRVREEVNATLVLKLDAVTDV